MASIKYSTVDEAVEQTMSRAFSDAVWLQQLKVLQTELDAQVWPNFAHSSLTSHERDLSSAWVWRCSFRNE